jgi:hypothetical protein
MNKFLIFLFINIGSVSVYSQQAFKINLKDMATVTFPSAPNESKMHTRSDYISTNNGIIYIASAEQIKKDLNDVSSKYTLTRIYNTLISGALAGSKSKLLYKNKYVLNGVEGVEFAYKTESAVSPNYILARAFYLNETIIFIGTSKHDSLQRNNQNVKSFFDSFKLTKIR